jgi:hypothetical protein
MVQMFPQSPSHHQYGRNIDPWCFDNHETMGTIKNKNFWSCAITVGENVPDYGDLAWELNNQSTVETVTSTAFGNSLMNFTEEEGTSYAILGPTSSPSDADWQAMSFALSSQCTPVPATACDIDNDKFVLNNRGAFEVPFNCTIAHGSPLDFSRRTDGSSVAIAFFDFH